MTPKEKAQELFMRNFEITVDDYCAKECALIAVYEVLDALANTDINQFQFGWHYWKEVMNEIQKL
jgi:hypothetical protein